MVRSRGVHEGYLQMHCSGSKLLYGLASVSNLIFFLYTVSVTQVATWEVYEKELFFEGSCKCCMYFGCSARVPFSCIVFGILA